MLNGDSAASIPAVEAFLLRCLHTPPTLVFSKEGFVLAGLFSAFIWHTSWLQLVEQHVLPIDELLL